jgi:hypothetical protein
MWNLTRICSLILVFLSCTVSAQAWEWGVPDRRENPTRAQQGFLAFPIYTHVPGIGSTIGAGVLSSHVFKTQANIVGVATTGDSNFIAAGLTEVHILSENLYFNFYGYATRIPFQLYDRGDASNQDQFVNLLRREYGATAEASLHFWERRFQLNMMVAPSRLTNLWASSPDGAVFSNRDNTEAGTLGSTVRAQLDFTDDDLDPRRGGKLQMVYHRCDTYDSSHSKYDSWNAFATAYIPVLKSSTWAFNVFRSWSTVIDELHTSEADLRASMTLNCGLIEDPGTRTNCQAAEDRRVKERVAENKYGTAALLGGPTQLRGYPIGRFRGSQSILYATEFRWNITDENTPFDFGFFSGARSVVQIAPFIELGTSVDPPEIVENAPLHATYGVGFRLGFSGTILRADAGMSKEGPEFTFFFGYPWDLSIL